MTARISLTQGTVGRAWAVQILDGNGVAVDMTSATSVTFSMASKSGGARKVNDAAAIVANGTYTLPDGSSQSFTPTDGVLIYQPTAGDVDTADFYRGQFLYLLSGAPVADPGYGYIEIQIQAAI